MDSLLNDLKDLPLKINDDLYFYSSNKQLNNGVEGMLKMWEYYEIHYTRPRKLLPYGNWSEANGLQLPKDEKWVRRRNLEVRRKKLREKKNCGKKITGFGYFRALNLRLLRYFLFRTLQEWTRKSQEKTLILMIMKWTVFLQKYGLAYRYVIILANQFCLKYIYYI